MVNLATDKQINYLTSLSNKVGRARCRFPEGFHNVSEIESINWEEERSKGMTVADASMMIDSLRSVIRGMNTILYLCNKRQV